MLKIEHIGIAVKDIEISNKLFQKLLGVPSYKEETVKSENVKTSFFQIGESKIELIASLDQEGVIAKFIDKKGEGVHHIAYEVEDIRIEMARLKKEGFILLSDEPKKGADNKLICFVHPKTSNGILVELCQEIG
jgi:methylmalonyl-CoA/ethylmalonyl-CoA epimerase